MNAKPCFWKEMAEGWGGDLRKERNGLLGEKRILRKHVKRISMEAEAYCLEKREILR